jgi:hypothetical protein
MHLHKADEVVLNTSILTAIRNKSKNQDWEDETDSNYSFYFNVSPLSYGLRQTVLVFLEARLTQRKNVFLAKTK